MRAGLTAFQLLSKCPDSIGTRLISLRLLHTSHRLYNGDYKPPERRRLERSIPSRIHIIGVGNIGGFIAHALAGVERPPPITLLLHSPTMLERWKRSKERMTLVQNGVAEHRWGFNINVKRNDDIWYYVPQDSKLAKEQKAAGGYPERDPALAHHEEIHNLIVASKATGVRRALESVKHRLTPYSTIAFVHNGLGIEEEINEHVFPDPETRPSYIFGVVSHGLNRTYPFVLQHAGVGTCLFSVKYTNPHARAAAEKTIEEYKEEKAIAAAQEEKQNQQARQQEGREGGDLEQKQGQGEKEVKPRQPEEFQNQEALQHQQDLLTQHKESPNEIWASSTLYLLRTLTRTPQLVATALPSDIILQNQLEKLAVNCVINPLTVVFDCLNGDLLYNYYVSRMQRMLLLEISAVICALPEMQGVPGIEARFAPERLRTLAVSVMANTASNTSSMLQDVRRQNPTEIRYINGYIVKRGEKLGIRCALNYMLTDMVVAGEKIKKVKELKRLPMVIAPEVAGENQA
ncbi:hypothetical protein AJ79_09244 [Helicocarpus griseus UAMH5409]|uniref:2-dehydropantoate 2-reductase n=1 Tax=Helicocarpus griseus UAMH5409 TaxID=1447875 RepID=A0A2B7WCX9_9EURO|nr:hypothetical protein AJ79_09244 [Helicocarpus griseus UAMH5409]